MSAIISEDGLFRYRLERDLGPVGLIIAAFGVNPSTANATENDPSLNKWMGFAKRNGGRRLILGNPHAYRATDVRELARVSDPVGPDNEAHLRAIITDADILWPCWGSRLKLPPSLHTNLYRLKQMIFESGKPVMILGLTKSGDPMHPLMLGYSTPLIPWTL